jgi:hypothetical protein
MSLAHHSTALFLATLCAAPAIADSGVGLLAEFKYPEWTCHHTTLAAAPRSSAERSAMEQHVADFRRCKSEWLSAMSKAEDGVRMHPEYRAMDRSRKSAWESRTNKARETRRWIAKARDFNRGATAALNYVPVPAATDAVSRPTLMTQLANIDDRFSHVCPRAEFAPPLDPKHL